MSLPCEEENGIHPGTHPGYDAQERASAGSEPSAAVTLRFVGWRDLHEDDDGAGGEGGRRFQFIGEFDDGGVPDWPMGWFFDARFRLSPALSDAPQSGVTAHAPRDEF